MDNTKLKITPKEYKDICNRVLPSNERMPFKDQQPSRVANCFDSDSRHFFDSLNAGTQKAERLNEIIKGAEEILAFSDANRAKNK